MPTADPDLLADRYGARRGRAPGRGAPRRYWIFGAAALLVSALIAVLLYRDISAAPIRAERTTFENLPDNSMRMTFEVTRDEPRRPAVCVVRVRIRDGSEGGRKEVYVPPGETAISVSTVVRSRQEPVTADVFGCSYQVPEYLSTSVPPSG